MTADGVGARDCLGQEVLVERRLTEDHERGDTRATAFRYGGFERALQAIRHGNARRVVQQEDARELVARIVARQRCEAALDDRRQVEARGRLAHAGAIHRGEQRPADEP